MISFSRQFAKSSPHTMQFSRDNWNNTAVCVYTHNIYIDGLVQERRNSSALAMELRLSCTNPSI